MRAIVLGLMTVLPTFGSAHPGHIVEVAGHNHWIAAGAIGAAALAALWGKLKEKRDDNVVEDEPELEEEAT